MRGVATIVTILWLLAMATVPAAAIAQTPANIASYRIEAQLDPASKTVTGTARITYRNPSADTLRELYLRLYLTAFSSFDTVWMQESGGQLRGDQADPSRLGDITIGSLRLADGTDLLARSTLDDTLLRVPLDTPLAPGATIELDVAWTAKLPRVFARTGYGGPNDTFFMVGQWYPKMAVYDRGAWDTEPWHANAEFFNDVGDYAVTITVPESYVVAGAGVPLGETTNADGTRSLRFESRGVTDYAFAASPDFLVASGTSGSTAIDVFYLPEHASAAPAYLDTALRSLEAYGAWYGAYPWPRLAIVDVPDDASGAGGMEYPALITVGTQGLPVSSGFVELVTSHEIGHQWWPMQTATNEARDPWLDEGLTEYASMRYLSEQRERLGIGPLSVNAESYERSSYASVLDAPLDLPAWEYDGGNYVLVYTKTALGMWTLEDVVGTARMQAALRQFLRDHRFQHPTSADFRESLEASLGPQPWFFDDYVAEGGTIAYSAEAITSDGAQSVATIRRDGSVRVPVEVQLTSRNGASRTERWDGQAATIAYRQPATDPIVAVQIDPRRKLHAELNIRDNGLRATPDASAVTATGGRLAFWTQLIAALFGLLG